MKQIWRYYDEQNNLITGESKDAVKAERLTIDDNDSVMKREYFSTDKAKTHLIGALDDINNPNIGKKLSQVLKGGQGSGNFGHAGRPGERGGSGAGSSGNNRRNKKEKEPKQFGNVLNEEKLAKHLGVPVNVARYMLEQGLVGVTIKDRPTPLSKDEVPKAEYDNADNQRHPGQCYDYTGRYLFDSEFNKELENIKVVHGTITDGIMTIGHAWIETPSGLIYEGSNGQFFKKADYIQKMSAVEERVYSRSEAKRNLLKYKHYGPWHNGAGYVNGAKGRKDE